MTMYVYPSPHGVDWKSPHHLTRSVVKNALTFKPRTIGHVSIRLEGMGENHLVGMTALDQSLSRKLILRDHLGLGSLFYSFPGLLEDHQKLEPELMKRLANGHFSFIRFALSKESFEKVKQYLLEYTSKNIGRVYGLPFRPRYGEGAGCSAFAASFIEIAGLMQDEYRKNWSGTVRIPLAYLGEPGKTGKERKVGIWKLLIPSAENLRWSEKNEPGRDVFFWDPDMMHRWILKKWDELKNHPVEGLQATLEQKSKAILVDSSKILPKSEPIWLT